MVTVACSASLGKTTCDVGAGVEVQDLPRGPGGVYAVDSRGIEVFSTFRIFGLAETDAFWLVEFGIIVKERCTVLVWVRCSASLLVTEVEEALSVEIG